ncbi:phage holin family protein [Bacillus thuringiensis]|uniref:phage holin family protein n=1 Tax=Bacillus thuringiensis TaxID=1428 RepID=UPI0035D83B34
MSRDIFLGIEYYKFVEIDYITGASTLGYNGELESKVGFENIVKKLKKHYSFL